MGALDRVIFRGRRFDKMTVAAILHAESFIGGEVPIMQGSYSTSVGASANTHAEGGAIDNDNGRFTYDRLEWGFRWAGWAYWERLPGPSWPHHAHGILLGHPKVASSAARQRVAYLNHRDGLVSNAYDGHWRPPGNIVQFRYPLGRVNVDVVLEQARAKASKKASKPSVRLVQRTLNLKINAGLGVDGIYGEKTRRAAAVWENLVGGDGDGILAEHSLRYLGAARFNVRRLDAA